MNSSSSTSLIHSCKRKSFLIVIPATIAVLFAVSFCIGPIFSPHYLFVQRFPGCVRIDDDGACVNDVQSLSPITTSSFRFLGLSRWNWRLVGGMVMDLDVTDGVNLTENVIVVSLNATLERRLSDDVSIIELEKIVKRRLSCRLTSSTIWRCVLIPLIDLQILYSNATYLSEVILFNNETNLDGISVVSSNLVCVTESEAFHRCLLYLKYAFAPLVAISLIVFVVRGAFRHYSLPDRILLVCGLAQLIQDVPVELLLQHYPIPYLKLLDGFSYVFLITCLFLYWAVLAESEIKERSAKFYRNRIFFAASAGFVYLLYETYAPMPGYVDPYYNHWSEIMTESTSLIFISLTTLLIAISELYLVVVIGRILIVSSISKRIKSLMTFCLILSGFTFVGVLLRISLTLIVYWSVDPYLDTLSGVRVTAASTYFLGLEGLWNGHVAIMLILMSKGKTTKYEVGNEQTEREEEEESIKMLSRQEDQEQEKAKA